MRRAAEMLPLMRSRISDALSAIGAARSTVTWARNAGGDLVQHRHRRTDLSRRAKAALEAVMVDEGGLHRMHAIWRATPSTVVIASPSCMTASVRQLLIAVRLQGRYRRHMALVATLLGAGSNEGVRVCVEQSGT